MSTTQPTALITGASSGIGAVYADRLARRGHPLVLVARNTSRLDGLANRLRSETGVSIDVLGADLADAAQLALVEQRLRDDNSIGMLINNAGMATPGGFENGEVAAQDQLIRVNVLALSRLVSAAVPGFLARGNGTIVNIASVLALAPEISMGMYSATKAYVLALSQSLNAELGARGLYVQAVLPAATRTEIWERSGRSVDGIEGLMEVDELVDAALVGMDRHELVSLPSLPDAAQWDDFSAARFAMMQNFRNAHAAPRYRTNAE